MSDIYIVISDIYMYCTILVCQIYTCIVQYTKRPELKLTEHNLFLSQVSTTT